MKDSNKLLSLVISILVSVQLAMGNVVYADEEKTLASVLFSETPGSVIIPPEDSDIIQEYSVTLEIKDSAGLMIADDECDYIKWNIKGCENDDGYISWNFSENSSFGRIIIRGGVSTYFCVLDAEVKRGDVVLVAEYPFMINTAKSTENIYPDAGYPVNMNEYPDSLVGYMRTAMSDKEKDPIMANWSIYGGNADRVMSIKKTDDGDKYFEFDQGGGSGSTLGLLKLNNVPETQIIFDYQTKFYDGTKNGSMFVFANNSVNNASKSSYVSAFEVRYNNGSLCLGSTESGTFTKGEGTVDNLKTDYWYRVVVSYDSESGMCYALVFDGLEKMGEIPMQKLNSAKGCSVVSITDGYPCVIRDMSVYEPQIDKMEIITVTDTVKIPDSGSVELGLALNMYTEDGFALTGDVQWKTESDLPKCTELTTTGNTAALSVSSECEGGIIVISASKNGMETKKTIRLVASDDSVIWLDSTQNITIPFSGTDSYNFRAGTMDASGNVSEDEITYKILDSTGTYELDSIQGVCLDSNGVLNVSHEAQAADIYIMAQNNEGLSAKIKVRLHGYSFVFGTDGTEDGYTVVGSENYAPSLGYGFDEADAVTVNEDSVSFTAGCTFRVDIPNGNYNIVLETTAETVSVEAVKDTSAVGIEKSGAEFPVAVCDGQLDISFDAEASLSSIVITQADKKTSTKKPSVYAIGDSTTNNSGHINSSAGTYAELKEQQKENPDLYVEEREYASWGNCVIEEMYSDYFSDFYNCGSAGKNSASYYRSGRLERVLLNIAPGDYVTVNMGINGETNEGFDLLIEKYYIQAILERGGIPVILTHTPMGPVTKRGELNYDADIGKFDCETPRNDNSGQQTLKRLADEYGLDLIDVSAWGNEYFNSLTSDDLDKANTANKTNTDFTAPATVFDVVNSWYPDHNHYTAELGVVFAQYIMRTLGEIENSAIGYSEIGYNGEKAYALIVNGKGEAATIYAAEYDENNILLNVALNTVKLESDLEYIEVTYEAQKAENVRAFVWLDMQPVKNIINEGEIVTDE